MQRLVSVKNPVCVAASGSGTSVRRGGKALAMLSNISRGIMVIVLSEAPQPPIMGE